jgi:hypothetical protein
MSRLRAAHILLFVFTTALLAGCITENSVNNTLAGTSSGIIPTGTRDITTVSVPQERPACPAYSYNGSYWISIDPLNDVRGTPFMINGTTNLPSVLPRNRSVWIMIDPVEQDPRLLYGEQSTLFYGTPFYSYIQIQESENCINTFSVNVTQLEGKSGEYFVSIQMIDSDLEHFFDPRNGTQFYYIRYKD